MQFIARTCLRNEADGFLSLELHWKTQISFICEKVEQNLYSLNPKFQTSSYMYLLRLFISVFVGPDRKPKRQLLFVHDVANIKSLDVFMHAH